MEQTNKKQIGYREAVRTRPGMYIGDTNHISSIETMLWEVLANSLDIFLNHSVTKIWITITKNCIQVRDDGPGFSLEKVEGKTFFERVLSQTHDVPSADEHFPHVHIRNDCYGIGLAPVNFLSQTFTAKTISVGHVYLLEYEYGKLVAPLKDLGSTQEKGTEISFVPDPAIFGDLKLDPNLLIPKVEQYAWLNSGLLLYLQEQEFYHPGGLSDAVLKLTEQEKTLFEKPLHINGSFEGVEVDIAFNWAQTGQLHSYVSQWKTIDGGSHVDGFIDGLKRVLKELAPSKSELTAQLVGVIHVGLYKPTFGGPSRDRIEDPRIRKAVREVLSQQLQAHFHKNPDSYEQICLFFKRLK